MPPAPTESPRALGLPAWCWGELAGTFLLVFFGCGSIVNGAGWLTVYLLAPLAGGLVGAGLYSRVFQPLQR